MLPPAPSRASRGRQGSIRFHFGCLTPFLASWPRAPTHTASRRRATEQRDRPHGTSGLSSVFPAPCPPAAPSALCPLQPRRCRCWTRSCPCPRRCRASSGSKGSCRRRACRWRWCAPLPTPQRDRGTGDGPRVLATGALRRTPRRSRVRPCPPCGPAPFPQRAWLATSLVPSAPGSPDGPLRWLSNPEGAAAMYASYRETECAPRSAPPAVEIHLPAAPCHLCSSSQSRCCAASWAPQLVGGPGEAASGDVRGLRARGAQRPLRAPPPLPRSGLGSSMRACEHAERRCFWISLAAAFHSTPTVLSQGADDLRRLEGMAASSQPLACGSRSQVGTAAASSALPCLRSALPLRKRQRAFTHCPRSAKRAGLCAPACPLLCPAPPQALHVVPKAGHWLHTDNPQALSRIMVGSLTQRFGRGSRGSGGGGGS